MPTFAADLEKHKAIMAISTFRNTPLLAALLFSFCLAIPSFSNPDSHDHEAHGEEAHDDHAHAEGAHGDHEEEDFNITDMIMHHIADANDFHVVKDFHIPLPVMMYNATEKSFHFMMSSAFEHGHKEVNGYVMDHGRVKSVHNKEVDHKVHGLQAHLEHADEAEAEAIEKQIASLKEDKHTIIDFSITKNVFSMLLVGVLMLVMFLSLARLYKKREGEAPRGFQGFMESLILFIRDEVARPNLGHKADYFLPYLLMVFFFIFLLNLLGLVPIFPGSANVTGNIAVTFTLAFMTAVVTNVSANKDYWRHIFWMPGVPFPIPLILMPIELIGIITKPFALMIRLFANITAGHIIVLSLVGLIFIFGEAGNNPGGAAVGAAVAVPFALFINLIELLVAFIQAFIFTMLSAVFIGLATEEHHH